MRVTDFAWGALPRLGKDDVAAAREAHCRLAQYFDLRRAPGISRELFAAELEGFGSAGGAFTEELPPSLGADLHLSGAELNLWLSVEPQVVALLLNRVLSRPSGLTLDKPLTPALRGAFHAVVGEICRRAAPGEPAALAPARAPLGPLWRVDFWLRLDGGSYRGRLAVGLRGAVAPQPVRAGALPVTLGVVMLQQTLSRAEFAALEVGDAVVFDVPWEAVKVLQGATPKANALLCGGTNSAALRVEITPTGLVLRGVAQLGYEAQGMAQGDTTVNAGAEAAVLDTPVVVRLEVGEVTLSARDWLALSAGDVLQTDVPLGDPVTLRVAGRVVARGTLVNVEGKLGVRLLAITPA